MVVVNSQASFAMNGGKKFSLKANVSRFSAVRAMHLPVFPMERHMAGKPMCFQANVPRFSSIRASSLPEVFHAESHVEDEILFLCLNRSDHPQCKLAYETPLRTLTQSDFMIAVMNDQMSSAMQGLFLKFKFPLVTRRLLPDRNLYQHIPDTVVVAHDFLLLAFTTYVIGCITLSGGQTLYHTGVADADLLLLKALSKYVLSGITIAEVEYAENPQNYQFLIDSDDFENLRSLPGGMDHSSALALEARIRNKYDNWKAYVGKELRIHEIFRYFVLPVKKHIFAMHMLSKKASKN